MRRFVEKSFITLFCLYNTSKVNPSIDLVSYLLISLIFSFTLDLYNNKRRRYFIYSLFIALCLYNNSFIFYLPLILYNLYLDLGMISLLTLPLLLLEPSISNILPMVLSIYLSILAKQFNTILDDNKMVRDGLKEDALFLKRYSDHLKIYEEKNIQIAILTERNRIARELHDSIGHSISSSILQVEALKLANMTSYLEGLNQLQDTLNNGMNDIRKSIHNLYNESFDLESKIVSLFRETPSIEINLNYKLEDELSYDLKFDILSIVKEAITNCVKHSNATELSISLLSQPKFYSVIIKDNGSGTNTVFERGMGLTSMNELANKYSGFMNYVFENGFKIHITLMKG